MKTAKFIWPEWRSRLIAAGGIALAFLRNPIQGMRQVPHWDWPFLLVCQAIAAAAAGVISGIVDRSFLGILTGILMVPITNAIFTALLAGFFYYAFAYGLNRPAPYQRLYSLLVFAQLPALAAFAVSPALPALILVGSALTGLLLLVGFVDDLHHDRRTMMRLLSTMFAIFVVFWLFDNFNNRRQVEAFREKATPESLDILERELKNQ